MAVWNYGAPNIFQPVYTRWWPIALPYNGDVGVDIFFLLSGYLIGNGVFREIARSGSFGWTRFLVRRVFRIVPVFWLAIAVALAAEGPEGCAAVLRRKLLFIEDVAANLQEDGLCVPQSWSVAVEMKLYLLTPLVVIAAFCAGKACGAPPARALVALCACCWAACCGARLAALPAVVAQSGSVWYTGLQYRSAPFFTGVATAALCSEQGPPAGPSSSSAARALHGTLTVLAWVVLLISMLYGGGGPLLGFESPMQKYPFGFRVAQLHFVLGRPLIGAAASYLLWQILEGRAPRLHGALAAPAWRPLARLSYSAYMMQVASFVLSTWLLSTFSAPDGAAARALSAFSETSIDLFLYAWLMVYVLFAFALAVPSYVLVEYPGIACGHRLAVALARPAAAGCSELGKPLV